MVPAATVHYRRRTGITTLSIDLGFAFLFFRTELSPVGTACFGMSPDSGDGNFGRRSHGVEVIQGVIMICILLVCGSLGVIAGESRV